MGNRSIGLKLLYICALIICCSPLVLGVLTTLAPAFSYLPVLGLDTFSFAGWSSLLSQPALWSSVKLTLIITFLTTSLTLIFSFALLARFYQGRYWNKLIVTLSPVFAFPHVAFAIGFIFLFSPSGWLFRFFDGVIQTPWVLVNDSLGLGISLALAIKSTPFLLFMSITPLQQLNTDKLLTLGTSLGYAPHQVWLKTILPLWLSHMRLPIAAVIGYALSVVDVSLILAPLRPAPLSVQIWEWIKDPSLNFLPTAGAASILLLVIALLVLFCFRYIEFFTMQFANSWQFNGQREPNVILQVINKITPLFYSITLLIPLLSTVVLTIWSFTFRWRFPNILPQSWSTKFWQTQWDNINTLLFSSINIALLSTLLSLFFAISCLEYKEKSGKKLPVLFLIIPLVIPQIGLLFGVRILTLFLPNMDYFTAVVWGHTLFVFPYVYLSLAPSWQAFDPRYQQIAVSLGSSPFNAWWRVKLPLLKNGVIFASIIGISVSLTQYLPTLILGAGRIATVTTEAVAVTSGHDRRIMAVYGLIQALPLLLLMMSSFYFSLKINKEHNVSQA